MRNFIVAGLLFLLLFTACGKPNNYANDLNSWLGASETDLIAAWGIPTRSLDQGNIRILEYHRNYGQMVMPGTQMHNTTLYPNSAYTMSTPATPGYSVPMTCTTTFTITGGNVTGWRYNGNNCK